MEPSPIPLQDTSPRMEAHPSPPTVSPQWEAPKRSTLRMTLILIALYLSLFIAALDQTITATSIPTITSALHSSAGYVWIGSAYLLAFAASAPIWAKVSDIWGRKPALLTAVALFAGASILAALSTNIQMLIAARALQGVAGGGLIQLVNITISDMFSLRRRTLVLGLLEVMWAVAGGAGPLIGGALTQLVSWRWCFWVSLPVCGIAGVLLAVFLDVHNPKTGIREGVKAVDWAGTLAIVGVTVMLLVGLNFGGTTLPWDSPTVVCLIVFGTLMIGVFLVSEKRLAKYPLMPLELFAHGPTNAAFLLSFAHGMVYIAAAYYLPLYLQSAKQASPFRSGLLVLPLVVTEAVAGIMVGVVMHQTGRYREVIWAGIALLTLGTGLYIRLDASSSIAEIVAFECVGGFGSGFLFEAPLIAIQTMVSQQDTATATATFGFLRNMAASISLVVGGVVFTSGMDTRAVQLMHAGLNSSVVDALSDGKAAANVDIIRTISDPVQRQAVEMAFSESLRSMWILYTCIGAVGVLASAFIVHNHLSDEHTETRTGLLEKARDIGVGNETLSMAVLE